MVMRPLASRMRTLPASRIEMLTLTSAPSPVRLAIAPRPRGNAHYTTGEHHAHRFVAEEKKMWRARRDSNSRPSASKANCGNEHLYHNLMLVGGRQLSRAYGGR